MQAPQFTVTQYTTRAAALEAAYHWLDNALRYEADGKSPKLVDTALGRAAALETHAFTLAI